MLNACQYYYVDVPLDPSGVDKACFIGEVTTNGSSSLLQPLRQRSGSGQLSFFLFLCPGYEKSPH